MARDIRVYSVFSEIFFLLATWTLTKLRPRAQPNFRLRETNDPGLVSTVVLLLLSPYIRVTPPPPFPARFPTSALLLFHPYSGDPSPSPYPHTSPYRTPPPQSKLLISYVFEWTLLAPRNFETLIFNNSASAHGILIFRSFNGKRPRPFVPAFPSYSLASYIRASPRSIRFARRLRTFPLAPRAKVWYPILARHSIAFPRTRAREEIKFRRSEIPSSRTPVADHCDLLSLLVNMAHRSQ